MWKTSISRRSFGLSALGLALVGMTAGAGAMSRRRFLFVHAVGGWDPLCVFAPMFASPLLQLEAGAEPLTVGDFNLVDAPGRPAVKEFFQRFGERTLLVNGLSTRSVNHLACMAIAQTGSLSDSRADWATLLAFAQADQFLLPHLVLNAQVFPGSHAMVVAHGEGLLQQTVDGSILGIDDRPLSPPTAAARARVDAYLAARGAGVGGDVEAAFARAKDLADAKDRVQFAPAADLAGRAKNAIRLLANGVTRCASVAAGEGSIAPWDTHGDNSLQSGLFQSLFTDLAGILDGLAAQKIDGGSLADETVVVVMSEMGRTPAFNATGGRDHWPFTSALVIGPGVTGGRTIGGFTDLYAGIGVDPASGEIDPSRPGIDAPSFGATLLRLGDADPAELLPGSTAIEGVLK